MQKESTEKRLVRYVHHYFLYVFETRRQIAFFFFQIAVKVILIH